MTPPNVQCIYHHNICFVLIVKIYVKPMLKSMLQILAFGGFPLLILKKCKNKTIEPVVAAWLMVN